MRQSTIKTDENHHLYNATFMALTLIFPPEKPDEVITRLPSEIDAFLKTALSFE